jgi:hypothetical protein
MWAVASPWKITKWGDGQSFFLSLEGKYIAACTQANRVTMTTVSQNKFRCNLLNFYQRIHHQSIQVSLNCTSFHLK